MAYWPQATIWPYMSCGPDMRHTLDSGGTRSPRNRQPNTMLMSRLGSSSHAPASSATQARFRFAVSKANLVERERGVERDRGHRRSHLLLESIAGGLHGTTTAQCRGRWHGAERRLPAGKRCEPEHDPAHEQPGGGKLKKGKRRFWLCSKKKKTLPGLGFSFPLWPVGRSWEALI